MRQFTHHRHNMQLLNGHTQSPLITNLISFKVLHLHLSIIVYGRNRISNTIYPLVSQTNKPSRLIISPTIIQKTMHASSTTGLHTVVFTQTIIGLKLPTQFLLLSSQESTKLGRQVYQANGHNQIKIVRDQFTKNMASHPINSIRL